MNYLQSSILTAASAAVLTVAVPAQADTILMDFGGSPTTTTGQPQIWNNFTEATAGLIQGSGNATNSGAAYSLLNASGAASGITMTVKRSFVTYNGSGPTATTTGFPASATRDSMYGTTENFAGFFNVFPELMFSGLNPATQYNFTFYASRGTTSDSRQTQYTLTGNSIASVLYEPGNNVNNVATIGSFLSDASGNIVWDMNPGPLNNNATHLTYLGVMQIDFTAAPVPEPTTTALVVLGLAGIGALARRKQ